MKLAPSGVILSVCLALFASMSSAAGVNLSWNACTPEGGVQQRSFACNSNSGVQMLYGSFALDHIANQAVGIEVVLDIATQSTSLPSWWRLFSAGSCRQASISVAFEFSAEPATACSDPWSGQAIGGIGAYQTTLTYPPVPGGDPRTARIRMAAAVPQDLAVTLLANTEYYAFRLTINSAKTVGANSCSGCSEPVCIKLVSIGLAGADGPSEMLTEPLISSVATWQNASDCSRMMNQRPLIWGAVRALYR